MCNYISQNISPYYLMISTGIIIIFVRNISEISERKANSWKGFLLSVESTLS